MERLDTQRTDGASTAFGQVVLWISVIGALNWGLVGFFNWDLVRAIFGGDSHTDASALSRVIYAIVGLGGLALAIVGPRLRATTRSHAARTAEVHG